MLKELKRKLRKASYDMGLRKVKKAHVSYDTKNIDKKFNVIIKANKRLKKEAAFAAFMDSLRF